MCQEPGVRQAHHSFFQENPDLGVQVLGLPGMFLLTTNTPQKSYMVTLTETNIALENRLSQKQTSIPTIHLEGPCQFQGVYPK